MTSDMTLKEFVEQHSQERVAHMMGMTQGAISQMLRSKRSLFVAVDSDQPCGYRFYEIKALGKSRAA
ncbi:Cro/CI family transcriptional regulator [Salinicola lusitanus]|uniref:Cro/CI family transcriptional regulator n=1 Tax=Salinicola lusitanus TaxID=1949085 RepID=UPI003CC9E62B